VRLQGTRRIDRGGRSRPRRGGEPLCRIQMWLEKAEKHRRAGRARLRPAGQMKDRRRSRKTPAIRWSRPQIWSRHGPTKDRGCDPSGLPEPSPRADSARGAKCATPGQGCRTRPASGRPAPREGTVLLNASGAYLCRRAVAQIVAVGGLAGRNQLGTRLPTALGGMLIEIRL
jgi:hypothetical protein